MNNGDRLYVKDGRKVFYVVRMMDDGAQVLLRTRGGRERVVSREKYSRMSPQAYCPKCRKLRATTHGHKVAV